MDELIEILNDRTASIADRDDAAMDLGDHDAALDALITVAADQGENDTILQACGTSIAEIWKRTGGYNAEILSRLAPAAAAEIRASCV